MRVVLVVDQPNCCTSDSNKGRTAAWTVTSKMLCAMFLLLAVAVLGTYLIGSQGPGAVPALILQSETDPVAEAGANRTIPQNYTLTFNGSASTDDTGVENLTFVWTFNDTVNDVTLTGMAPSYKFQYIGVINVTLNVTDPDGNYSTDVMTVTVIVDSLPPVVDAGPPVRQLTQGDPNCTLTLRGVARDNVGIANYTWNITYGGQSYYFYTMNVTFAFLKPGNWSANLTCTDLNGNIGWELVNIKILKKPTFVDQHWMFLFIWLPIIIVAALVIVSKLRKDRTLVTKTDIEKAKLQWKNIKKTWGIFKMNRLGLAGLIVLLMFAVMAVFAPWLSTVPDPNNTVNFEPTRIADGWMNPLPPSLDASPYTGQLHPLGTDHLGRDIYSMTVYGARASLEVGIIATLISVIVGTVVGLGAGYFGKITDEVLMRVTDFFLVLPWFPLMIVMMAILGQKFIWVVVVIGITSWPSTARIVRSQVLTVKERQFIVRARAIGAQDAHIIKKHIMPNVLPLIFANTVLLIAVAIFSEAFLDFFGLGDTTVISWGAMLEAAYEKDAFLIGAWWWIGAPGFAIVLMVLSFSLVGYAVDDVLNPKLRRR